MPVGERRRLAPNAADPISPAPVAGAGNERSPASLAGIDERGLPPSGRDAEALGAQLGRHRLAETAVRQLDEAHRRQVPLAVARVRRRCHQQLTRDHRVEEGKRLLDAGGGARLSQR